MSNCARPADRFADQVLPYARLLHTTALRLTGNPANADDLVQETYAKAYAGFGTVQQGTNLPARGAAAHGRRELGGGRRARPDAGPVLRQALRELPSQLSTTVYLADAEGYSYAEIAEITGVPLGTVMSRLHRGRRRLRARLAAEQRPAPPRSAVPRGLGRPRAALAAQEVTR